MADSDGKVRIIIDTNAKEAEKQLNDVSKSFNKNAEEIKKTTTAYSTYEKAIQENITLLREMALSGQQNTDSFKKVAEQTKEYKKAIDEANNAVNKATGGINAQSNPISGLTSKLKGLIGAYIGIRGAAMALNYVLSSVEAYRTQEIAIASLNNTLKNAGVYSAQYSSQIQALASEIQSYSNYGDEAVIKAQALGQSFAGQIPITEEATRAVVDFAAATGMDLEQAFSLFGKSVGSSTNALARYGVELQKGMTDAQKMDSIVKQLGDRYDGTAKQMANATVQVKNALGDLSEAFGSLFNSVISDNQKTIINFVNSWADAINWLRAKIGNIQNASLLDAQARIRQIYVEQEKIQGRFKNHTATTRDAQRLEQLKNEENQALLRIKNLTKQEAEITKNQKPIKFTDDFSASYSSSGGGVSSKGTSSNAKAMKDDYEKLQQAVSSAKREIELAAVAHGTSSEEVQQAFSKYRELSTQLAQIDSLFSNEKTKVTENAGAYQELNQKISELKTQLLDLITVGDTSSDLFVNLTNEYQNAVSQMEQINKTFNDSLKDDFTNNFKSIASQLSSSLSNAILTPLAEGETYLQRFGNIGLNIIQSIGQKALDYLIEQVLFGQQNIANKTAELGVEMAITQQKGLQLSLQQAIASATAVSGFAGLGFANGGVFQNGNVIPFATGGVVSQPTTFPMANGSTGLMGEAGAEAIMPLKRNADGKLGVEASGVSSTVNIYNYSDSKIETVKRPNGDTDVFIKKVNAALSSERTQSGFSAAMQRNNNVGIQAS